MLSKALLKRISSLENKKHRKESGLFVAEGSKTVLDLTASGLKVDRLIATDEWIKEHSLQVEVEITSGSSAGTWEGTIKEGSEKVLAG